MCVCEEVEIRGEINQEKKTHAMQLSFFSGLHSCGIQVQHFNQTLEHLVDFLFLPLLFILLPFNTCDVVIR